MPNWQNRNWVIDQELYEKWAYMQEEIKTSKLRLDRLNNNYKGSPPNSENYLSEINIIVSHIYTLGILVALQSITLNSFNDRYDYNWERW